MILAVLPGRRASRLTWPRAAYLVQGRLPRHHGDVASYVWDLWWVAHQVAHLGNPFFTSHMAAPVGIQLGFDTTDAAARPGDDPGHAGVRPVGLVQPADDRDARPACYAMYRAARLWLRTEAGAIAAGAFFGLSSMLAWQDWYHLNIAAGTRVPADDAGGRGPAAPPPRPAAGRDPGPGARRQRAGQPGVGGAWPRSWPRWRCCPGCCGTRPGPGSAGALALGALAAAVVASPQLIAMAQQARAGRRRGQPAPARR